MNVSWPWGNYWQDPERIDTHTPHLEVEPSEPSTEPILFGPDGEPIPTRPAVPVGFQVPNQENS